MTVKRLRDRIGSLCTHVLFDYNGKACGVDPFDAGHFDMWCGEDFMEAHSIEEVMQEPFFEGKALQDIIDQIENVEGINIKQRHDCLLIASGCLSNCISNC